MRLLSTSEILQVREAHHTRGVTFSSSLYQASTVTMSFTKWLDMGRPPEITVRIEAAPPRSGPVEAVTPSA